MRVALAIVAGCVLQVAGWAQPMPRAATFRWDAPQSLTDAIGYELQWGPQQTAQLPIHITEYAVENFPLGFSQPVTVRTLGNGTNSEPVEIRIFNVIANFEENTGSGWAVVETAQVMREVKSNAMIRVRLEGAIR